MKEEPRWHASIAVIVALILYLRLPPKLTFGPVWILPVLVIGLLLPLLLSHDSNRRRLNRALATSLIGVLNFFNIASAILLIVDLVDTHAKHHGLSAGDLLKYGGLVWATNVIVYALWFWEIDRPGPEGRDFLFPQFTIGKHSPEICGPGWRPYFLDYLYLSFTNALAFSPTDVMPLTRIAKMLMLLESLISFVTVALILARSVNILS